MILPTQCSLIDLLKQICVAGFYALLLYIGDILFEGGDIVGHFEPTSGFALAALLLGGKRYAWGVFLGAALMHAISGSSFLELAIIATGDALQALCGAWLLTRKGKFDQGLQSLRGYLRLILLGGCISIAIGSLAVNTALLFSGSLTPDSYFHSLLKWWMSDTLGVILITPLILVWWQIKDDWRKTGLMTEIALLFGSTLLVDGAIFLGWWNDTALSQVADAYWLFLFTTWAAVRIGMRATIALTVMTAVCALLGAIHGTGYFASDIGTNNLVNYWFFMVILSVVGMALATHFAERRRAEKEIYNLAFYDTLTRLPNRQLFINRLQQALASSARSSRPVALLLIDLDHFKNINSTLGHDAGDMMLQQVAQRLEQCMRKEDTVARLGGDEFIIMLQDMAEQELEAAVQTKVVSNKILATLRQPYQLAKYECHSTPSIGATLFNNSQPGADELMKQADIAMYQAKKDGRNTLCFFNPHMQAHINDRASLEDELRKALDNRQLHVYYQIQVDSKRRPLGAESLIRWIHPERGFVSPAKFIPLAEETRLILPIGQWVLDTACAQIKAWQQDTLTRDLVLAVNVSAKQFHQADFVAIVQAAVQRHEINPRLLKLELTESLLLENIDDIIATMNALKEIGVQFSLDDFGTGYSSLQYLKRLPLDQLKIDQSFVRDIVTDNSDKAIVHTIIAMAQSLDLDVIAEGVETEEQQQLLLNMGCAHYQGYLFSKPVAIEQFEELLKQKEFL